MTSREEIVEALIEAWKLMVGRIPGAKIEQAGGVATMFANVPMPFLNLSTPERPVADARSLRTVLALAGERARACEHGSLVALCEGWVPQDWQSMAAEEGFTLALNMTGMAADQLLPPRRPLPQLDFRRVRDEVTARDIAMINGHAYGMPLELFECICNLHLWHEDSFGFVGYTGGRAVTAAAVFPVAGAMYVAFVATMPEEHGKGYAEAVMRHAIEQARPAMGCTRMTLHASDMGHPLYRAMGFDSGAKVILLAAPSPGSVGH
jgi:GNAT superfamily N-acetyltransferase